MQNRRFETWNLLRSLENLINISSKAFFLYINLHNKYVPKVYLHKTLLQGQLQLQALHVMLYLPAQTKCPR